MLQAHSPYERFLRRILASRFFTISAFLHLLLIVLFGGKVLFNKYVEPPDFQEVGDSNSADAAAVPPQAPEPLPPPPSLSVPPPVTRTTLTTITTLAATSMPAFSMPLPAPAPPVIRPGGNKGGVPVFKPINPADLPKDIRQRVEDHKETINHYRGNASTEQNVQRALDWLQAQQHSDGTWGEEFHSAFTGLALLCYLGHGDTPQWSHQYGVVVTNAIHALVAQANAHNGWLTGFDGCPGKSVYDHAIATYALCEAYTMTKDERLVPIIKRAVDYIVKGQRQDGGWTYGYDTTPDNPTATDALQHHKSDTSVTGWQVQALKAAHLTGIAGIDDGVHSALDQAMRSLDRVFSPKDGSFGYRTAGDGHVFLTGAGALAKLFWLGRPDRIVHEALKEIESRDLNYGAADCNIYAWYYDTQACYQAQGAAWVWWKDRFQTQLTGKQSSDGSWPPTGGQDQGAGKTDNFGTDTTHDGPIYRTTLCCLMLEVFYRYLPTSQETSLGGGVQGL